jgi:hypothetical protein
MNLIRPSPLVEKRKLNTFLVWQVWLSCHRHRSNPTGPANLPMYSVGKPEGERGISHVFQVSRDNWQSPIGVESGTSATLPCCAVLLRLALWSAFPLRSSELVFRARNRLRPANLGLGDPGIFPQPFQEPPCVHVDTRGGRGLSTCLRPITDNLAVAIH